VGLGSRTFVAGLKILRMGTRVSVKRVVSKPMEGLEWMAKDGITSRV
jgi:hypothetical protein